MNKFKNPMTIVKNPESAPQIYSRNKRILRRHINASLLQLFFKRKEYDDINLTFEGMSSNDGTHLNLVESLGSLSGFLDENTDLLYNRKKFLSWLDSQFNLEQED